MNDQQKNVAIFIFSVLIFVQGFVFIHINQKILAGVSIIISILLMSFAVFIYIKNTQKITEITNTLLTKLLTYVLIISTILMSLQFILILVIMIIYKNALSGAQKSSQQSDETEQKQNLVAAHLHDKPTKPLQPKQPKQPKQSKKTKESKESKKSKESIKSKGDYSIMDVGKFKIALVGKKNLVEFSSLCTSIIQHPANKITDKEGLKFDDQFLAAFLNPFVPKDEIIVNKNFKNLSKLLGRFMLKWHHIYTYEALYITIFSIYAANTLDIIVYDKNQTKTDKYNLFEYVNKYDYVDAIFTDISKHNVTKLFSHILYHYMHQSLGDDERYNLNHEDWSSYYKFLNGTWPIPTNRINIFNRILKNMLDKVSLKSLV